jgi:CheY-like chemotaxis protein
MANVLVVDDQASLLELVSMILTQTGHTVLCASSGVEALMVFSSYHSKIDLVLTDVQMPGMNGIELLNRIRALDPSISILLMSGFVPDDFEIPEDLRLLNKPFQPGELVEAVEQALATARSRNR